jgi:hypothetical protein
MNSSNVAKIPWSADNDAALMDTDKFGGAALFRRCFNLGGYWENTAANWKKLQE